MRRAVVVGAGIVGTTAALYLAREGMAVTVLDAHPASGLETSFANGGLVTPTSAMPWSSPGAPRLLLRWLGREKAPLLLRPSAVPRLGLWGLRFLANCRRSKYVASARTLSRFAQGSLEETEGLIAQRVVQYDLSHGGLLELYRDDAGVAARDAHADLIEGMGMRVQRLDGPGVVALEPHLAPVADSIRAGLLLLDDAWGDARLFTRAAEDAARRAGVDFRFGTAIQGIDVAAGRVAGVRTASGPVEADIVVVCAGTASPQLLRPFGVRLPIQPVKGYSLTIPHEEIGFLPGRPLVDETAHMGITPLKDQLRIAGTVEFDGFNRTLRQGRVDNLVEAFRSLFPKAPEPKTYSPWCGFRPMSADGLPVIDRTPVEGLFVNSGHGALGWTLACGSARYLTDLVVGRPLKETPFAIDRSYW